MPRLRPWLALAILLTPGPGIADEPKADDGWYRGQIDDLVGLYKHLHTHPELSLTEVRTADRMAKELQELGFVFLTAGDITRNKRAGNNLAVRIPDRRDRQGNIQNAAVFASASCFGLNGLTAADPLEGFPLQLQFVFWN